MKRILLTMVAALAAACLVESTASAQGFGGGRVFGQYGAFGGFGSSNIFDLYRTGRTPIPPYFALNPPVYYSYPVPRTYGYSPFYYPGTVKTPDVIIDMQPQTIINPFVPSSAKSPEPAPAPETSVNASPVKPAATPPLMVENPFFNERGDIYTVSH